MGEPLVNIDNVAEALAYLEGGVQVILVDVNILVYANNADSLTNVDVGSGDRNIDAVANTSSHGPNGPNACNGRVHLKAGSH